MTQIALDRWESKASDANVKARLAEVAARANALPDIKVGGRSPTDIVRDIFDNASPEYIKALFDISRDNVGDYASRHGERNSNAAFPNRMQDDKHVTAISVLSAIWGGDLQTWSTWFPGQGYTGKDNALIAQSSNGYLILGTLDHDTYSSLDLFIEDRAEINGDFKLANAAILDGDDLKTQHSLNYIFYGVANVALSAVAMAIEAYSKSIENWLIPPTESLFDFLRPIAKMDDITNLLAGKATYNSPLMALGDAAGQIAYTLSLYYGGDNALASQLVTNAFSKTIGTYVGDAAALHLDGKALGAGHVFDLFVNELVASVKGLGADALSAALIKTLKIESPLGQLFAGSISSSVTNVLANKAIDQLSQLQLFGISPDTFKSYLGIKDTDTVLDFKRVVFSGDVFEFFEANLGAFVTSQVFNYLDAKWTTFNLSNLGSSIGGIIGSYLAPGIGSFIGQVSGGIVWDLLDGDPRSFHSVRYDQASGEFVTQFSFREDGGQIALSRDLAESAMGSIQLATIIIGGEVRSITAFEYGHYNEELTYAAAGGGRVRFDDAEEMLARGVLAQLRTLQVTGGNEYAKSLLTRSGYTPSLDRFFVDLGVADVYDMHKADPYLYGLQMINIDDAGARRYLLSDWQGTLAAAHALGLDALAFNDGGEFVVRVGSAQALSGGRGDDFIYAEDGTGRIEGGDGDDIVRFDVAVLTNGASDWMIGGAGTDRYIGDFSAFTQASGQKGIHFDELRSDWQILYGPVETAASFDYFEQFSLIGTFYDDYVDFTDRMIRFDGGAGIDTVNLYLTSATADVTLDLTGTGPQLIYRSADLRGVERVDDVRTGAGNDTIRIGASILIDEGSNWFTAGDGFDRFFGDFSGFTQASGQKGIHFDELRAGWHILYGPVETAASFDDYEQFNLIGTRYDDYVDFTDRMIRFDGGAGMDTVNLMLTTATGDVTLDLTGAGPQLIYGAADLRGIERVDDVRTGSGDDTIRIGTAILVDEGSNWFTGGEGHDRFFGDFSAFTQASGQKGIAFEELRTGWHILYGPTEAAASFDDYEQFSLIGTRYDDHADITARILGFDGGAGIDRIDFNLSSALSDIVLDLTVADRQLVYGGMWMRSVERVEDVATGAGDDIIRIGSPLLTDNDNNQISAGAGLDQFVGDFSTFSSADGRTGIRFHSVRADWQMLSDPDGMIAAELHDFESYVLTGTAYQDQLLGGDPNDSFDGGGDNDVLKGGGGDDVLQGGAGDDAIDGGTGVDMTSYLGAAGGVTVHLHLTGAQATGGAGTDTLVGVEGVLGSRFADRLGGDGGANLLSGEAGADSLEGGSGHDALLGGDGDDWLEGGSGDDTLVGGAGYDFAGYIGAAAGVEVDLAWLEDQNTRGAGIDTLVGIEGLYGSAFADRLSGDGGANLLSGEAGADSLEGGSGHDALWGGDGDDWLEGGSGDDTLVGRAGYDFAGYIGAAAGVEVDLAWLEDQNTRGAGIDTLVGIEGLYGSAFGDRLSGDDGANQLYGSGGGDILLGRGGADLFVLTTLNDSTTAAPDRIGDFTAGDQIDLRLLDADRRTAVDDAFVFVGGSVLNGARQVRVAGSGTEWRIEADVDGDGAADLTILVNTTSAYAWAAADFLL